MKKPFSLIFSTNIWTHHQAPIAQELVSILGEDRFRFVVFQDVDDERRMMGWDEQRTAPWVIGPPKTELERSRLHRICMEADVMVLGTCPDSIFEARAASGKLTFVQSERKLKKPFHHLRMLNPRYARGIGRFRATVNHPSVHALAIGHDAPRDLQTMGAFGDRIWKWGYFVAVNSERPAPIEDRPVRLMWAGRMIPCKRVDVLLRAIERIQDEPWFGSCTVIGDGEERDGLLMLARRLHLKPGTIKIEHSLPFQEVRSRMRQHDLYVFPSNRYEGWGAVVGEAMSEGCVVVANERAGSARELLTHGETGFLFGDGDVEHLASVIERTARDFQLRMAVRERAWERINALWAPRVAAERLIALVSGLLGISEMPSFDAGPCTRAVKRSAVRESADKEKAISPVAAGTRSVPMWRISSYQKAAKGG